MEPAQTQRVREPRAAVCRAAGVRRPGRRPARQLVGRPLAGGAHALGPAAPGPGDRRQRQRRVVRPAHRHRRTRTPALPADQGTARPDRPGPTRSAASSTSPGCARTGRCSSTSTPSRRGPPTTRPPGRCTRRRARSSDARWPPAATAYSRAVHRPLGGLGQRRPDPPAHPAARGPPGPARDRRQLRPRMGGPRRRHPDAFHRHDPGADGRALLCYVFLRRSEQARRRIAQSEAAPGRKREGLPRRRHEHARRLLSGGRGRHAADGEPVGRGVFGYASVDELIGGRPTSCGPTPKTGREAAGRSGKIRRGPGLGVRGPAPDRSPGHVRLVQALRDDAGRFAGYEGIARDVTERRQSELRLRQSERRFGAV